MKKHSSLVLVQKNPDYAVQLDTGHGFYGWLFKRFQNGQFVSVRKLQAWEIMQAEDQRDIGIVQEGNTELTIRQGDAGRCG